MTTIWCYSARQVSGQCCDLGQCHCLGKDLQLIALGYTGHYTAEHIVKSLPTNLRWALAGRSATKLAKVAAEIKSLNPDRPDPGEFLLALVLPTHNLLRTRHR